LVYNLPVCEVMKNKKLITTAALITFFAGNSYAQDNNVVLDYDQITIGYFHNTLDTNDGDINANGIGLAASARYSNFVVSLGVGNSWIDDIDASVLQIGGGVGYIFELSDSLHLVPSVSLDFERIHDFEYYYGDSWVATPSISLNYAAAENVELSLAVGYSEPFNTELLGEDISSYMEGSFAGSVRAEYAISNNLGLIGSVAFSQNQTAYGVGLSLHY
jgi:hypothetical protein